MHIQQEKSVKRMIVVVVLLALLVPGVLMAQEELSLEGLSEQISSLVERVVSLEEKLEPVVTTGGECVQYDGRSLQRETVTKHLETFGEDIERQADLESVRYNIESGLTTYSFSYGYPLRRVTETWRQCEFLDHGEWVEE